MKRRAQGDRDSGVPRWFPILRTALSAMGKKRQLPISDLPNRIQSRVPLPSKPTFPSTGSEPSIKVSILEPCPPDSTGMTEPAICTSSPAAAISFPSSGRAGSGEDSEGVHFTVRFQRLKAARWFPPVRQRRAQRIEHPAKPNSKLQARASRWRRFITGDSR